MRMVTAHQSESSLISFVSLPINDSMFYMGGLEGPSNCKNSVFEWKMASEKFGFTAIHQQ